MMKLPFSGLDISDEKDKAVLYKNRFKSLLFMYS